VSSEPAERTPRTGPPRLPGGGGQVRRAHLPRDIAQVPPAEHTCLSRYALNVAVAATDRECTAASSRASAAVSVHGTPLP
jgi:hypothetical protein